MTSELRSLRVEKLSSHGEGIAFSEGKAIFIPYTIPGELVDADVVEAHSSFARARLARVLEASPHRVEAPCPLFEICGGCTLQHIDYAAQLAFKQAAAREVFERIGGIEAESLPIISSESYHYRNRTQIHAAVDGSLGFTRVSSREVVKTPRCPTLVPTLERWLIGENRKANPYRTLSALIGDKPRFTAFGQDDRVYIEGRDAYARATVRGKNFQFPTGHFFQSNLGMVERLIEREIEMLGAGGNRDNGGTRSGERNSDSAGTGILREAPVGASEAPMDGAQAEAPEREPASVQKRNRALDLYSGAGLFSLFLADRFESIECVESEVASMEAARMNLRGTRAQVHFSDIPVERWIKTPRARYEFECIVADPPRTGLAPEVRAWLGGIEAGTLVYVSCDHASLARDLRDLKGRGWSIEDVTLYDFYPQTGRLEAAARLTREAR